MTATCSRTIILGLAVLSILLLSGTALANSICSISTVGVAFGTYDVFSATNLSSTGSVTYDCSVFGPPTTITIDLNRGNAPSFFPRQMKQAGQSLNYNLYLNAGASQVWGDGTGGSNHYGPVFPQEGEQTTVTIFGQIPAGQDVGIGSYSDTIIATINF